MACKHWRVPMDSASGFLAQHASHPGNSRNLMSLGNTDSRLSILFGMEPTAPEPAELRSWFMRALDLAPAERARLLADPGLSPGFREELQAMLDLDTGSETFFKGIIRAAQPPLPGVGERFGPFETRELIG